MCKERFKISIITAVYNKKETVGQALESLFSQCYSNFESIVIDGASTDGTLDVLESFRNKIRYLITEKDDGIYDALNKGISLASGDIVGFLHADDLLENDDVLKKISATFEDASIEAVYGDLVYVNNKDVNQITRYWKAGFYDEASFKQGWMPPHPTFYARRSVYERIGVFDKRYRISADYDSILRFLAVGKLRASYIPEVLVRMRVGGISNRSIGTIIQKSLEDFDILRRNNVGGLFTLLIKNTRKISQYWIR